MPALVVHDTEADLKYLTEQVNPTSLSSWLKDFVVSHPADYCIYLRSPMLLCTDVFIISIVYKRREWFRLQTMPRALTSAEPRALWWAKRYGKCRVCHLKYAVGSGIHFCMSLGMEYTPMHNICVLYSFKGHKIKFICEDAVRPWRGWVRTCFAKPTSMSCVRQHAWS